MCISFSEQGALTCLDDYVRWWLVWVRSGVSLDAREFYLLTQKLCHHVVWLLNLAFSSTRGQDTKTCPHHYAGVGFGTPTSMVPRIRSGLNAPADMVNSAFVKFPAGGGEANDQWTPWNNKSKPSVCLPGGVST